MHFMNDVVNVIYIKDACLYLEVVDPEDPQQTKDVIHKLAAEVREMRDNVRTSQNECHLMMQDDRAIYLQAGATLKK